MPSWKKIRGCLQAQGFESVIAVGCDAFRGDIAVGKITAKLEIRISDYNFIVLPKIFILNIADLQGKLSAHIVTDGSLCYADRATFLLDRFQPEKSILRVLEQVKNTLRTLLHGNPTPEIMAELAAYWGGPSYLLLDNHHDLNTVHMGAVTFANKHSILVAGKTSKRLETWASATGASFEGFFKTPVVHCNGEILPPKGKMNFKEVLLWVMHQIGSDTNLKKLLKPKGNERPSLLLVGTNAVVGFRAKDFPLIKKARKGGFRQSSLPDLWFSNAASVEIERFHCLLAAHSEVTARNLNSMAPLSNKKIALIGCGTIGGYLSRALVQLGAGSGSDFLVVDEQILTPENLGRHALGVRHLNQSKAVGIKKWLKEDFPDISVQAQATEASRTFDRLAGYDLVIDATGDQQFSDTLNAHALSMQATKRKFPPVLYTMIFGNGFAVQSYMCELADNTACYKCLKPRFEEDWRYSPILREFGETDTVVRPCAQGAFAPFSVSASLMCAALAAQHAASFFEDNYANDLRTERINKEKTREIPYRNIKKSDACPACHKQVKIAEGCNGRA